MKNIYYYEPIVNVIASNGSERLGAQATTKMWEDKIQYEVTMSGKNRKEAHEKLLKFISSDNKNKIIEVKCDYYFCSEAVVQKFKPFHVSKPFKSGFQEDEDNYYVAWLNFDEVEKYYTEVIEPDENSDVDFWCRECVSGQMDVSKMSMKSAKNKGLLLEISEKLSITAVRNQAMTIRNLADRFSCNPVELIDKYVA